jgi:ABC-type uncharacterized transport system fused permease/ATPase subunit
MRIRICDTVERYRRLILNTKCIIDLRLVRLLVLLGIYDLFFHLLGYFFFSPRFFVNSRLFFGLIDQSSSFFGE